MLNEKYVQSVIIIYTHVQEYNLKYEKKYIGEDI